MKIGMANDTINLTDNNNDDIVLKGKLNKMSFTLRKFYIL